MHIRCGQERGESVAGEIFFSSVGGDDQRYFHLQENVISKSTHSKPSLKNQCVRTSKLRRPGAGECAITSGFLNFIYLFIYLLTYLFLR